jgi:prepilin-type N-terminal cleavage/methylation domain-containing protein
VQDSKGFTIIELIVAIVIIAVLANLVMSTLSNYIIRARLTEGLILVEKHKHDLELFFQENNVDPKSAINTEYCVPPYTQQMGKFGYTVIGKTNSTCGVIEYRIGNMAPVTDYNGGTLQFIPTLNNTGNIVWKCGFGNLPQSNKPHKYDLNDSMVPKICEENRDDSWLSK